MFKPLNNRIILERCETEAQEGKLYVPPSKEAGYDLGRVVASACSSVSAGQQVYFTTYGPISLRYEGKEYVVVRSEDILATHGL
jgi:co-chaperonin GroES (HSP10)